MGIEIRNDCVRARRRQDLIRLSQAGLDLPTLLDETVRMLRKSIPYEAGCWHALDPDSLIETSYRAVNLPAENPVAAEIEYLNEDYNQFATLARAPKHTGILSEATGGIPERSLRYRTLIRPFGLNGELRASFVFGGAAWGSICLLRERSSGDFLDEEAAFLEDICAPIGRGLRTALLLKSVSLSFESEGPGLILFNDRFELTAVSPGARRLLEELSDGPTGQRTEQDLPYVVHAVAARAQSTGPEGGHASSRAHVRTQSGRWLTLHGCSFLRPDARVAVIIESEEPPRAPTKIAAAYGLTARETEMVGFLLKGVSTKQIAAALGISPYTVQEHFTAIFNKVGVRSRRELVGKLLLLDCR